MPPRTSAQIFTRGFVPSCSKNQLPYIGRRSASGCRSPGYRELASSYGIRLSFAARGRSAERHMSSSRLSRPREDSTSPPRPLFDSGWHRKHVARKPGRVHRGGQSRLATPSSDTSSSLRPPELLIGPIDRARTALMSRPIGAVRACWSLSHRRTSQERVEHNESRQVERRRRRGRVVPARISCSAAPPETPNRCPRRSRISFLQQTR